MVPSRHCGKWRVWGHYYRHVLLPPTNLTIGIIGVEKLDVSMRALSLQTLNSNS